MSEETEIEYFVNNLVCLSKVDYDTLCEDIVRNFKLHKKSRKADLKDRCHFFFLWWNTNKDHMKRYTSLSKIGELCGGLDHATVSTTINHRVCSWNYEENTKKMVEYINEQLI